MPSAALAALTLLSSSPWRPLPLSLPAALFTEVPPTLLRLPAATGPPACPAAAAGALALYLATGYTGLCLANASALPVAQGSAALGLKALTCSLPFAGESWRDFPAVPPTAIPPTSAHKRNYDGVMGAAVMEDGLLLVRHGEHNNELCWGNGNLYQGMINPTVPAAQCFSGYHNGSGFEDCQPAYNAFVSGAVLGDFSAATCFGLGGPGNASTLDLGPLTWPVGGYLTAEGAKASYGVRQPSLVRGWQGQAVLLWIDNSLSSADVWAAQALAAQAPFYAFNAGSGRWDLPVLPASVASRGVMGSLQEGSPAGVGGKPALALAPEAGAVHAAAARLRVGGQPSSYYLVVHDVVNYTQCRGEEEGLGSRLVRELMGGGGRGSSNSSACTPPWRLFLRVTQDFVAFSPPLELADYAAAGGWGQARLAYPNLLSSDGRDSSEVDAEGFYVMGTCAQADEACGGGQGPQVTVAHVAVALG
jgi:hypothetical protein